MMSHVSPPIVLSCSKFLLTLFRDGHNITSLYSSHQLMEVIMAAKKKAAKKKVAKKPAKKVAKKKKK